METLIKATKSSVVMQVFEVKPPSEMPIRNKKIIECVQLARIVEATPFQVEEHFQWLESIN